MFFQFIADRGDGLFNVQISHDLMNQFHDQIVREQAIAGFFIDQNLMMKIFEVDIGGKQYRVKIGIAKKPMAFQMVMIDQMLIKALAELNNGAFIRNVMGVGNRMFVTGFGQKDFSIVGIVGVAKYVVNKIAFADKTDGKRLDVFPRRRAMIRATAFKIQNTIKIGMMKYVNVGLHNLVFSVKRI